MGRGMIAKKEKISGAAPADPTGKLSRRVSRSSIQYKTSVVDEEDSDSSYDPGASPNEKKKDRNYAEEEEEETIPGGNKVSVTSTDLTATGTTADDIFLDETMESTPKIQVAESNSENALSKSSSGVGKYLRWGKWTAEEEAYTNQLITDFIEGVLVDVANGTTMRSWLSTKLHCCPMRISKHFVGKASIGKKVYAHDHQRLNQMTPEEKSRRIQKRKKLESKFVDSWKSITPDDPSRVQKENISPTKSLSKSVKKNKRRIIPKTRGALNKKSKTSSSNSIQNIAKEIATTAESSESASEDENEEIVTKDEEPTDEESLLDENDLLSSSTHSSETTEPYRESCCSKSIFSEIEAEEEPTRKQLLVDNRMNDGGNPKDFCMSTSLSLGTSPMASSSYLSNGSATEDSFDLSVLSAKGMFPPVMDDLTMSPVSVFDLLPETSTYSTSYFSSLDMMLSSPSLSAVSPCTNSYHFEDMLYSDDFTG